MSATSTATPATTQDGPSVQEQAPVLLQTVAGHIGHRIIVMG